MNTNLLTIMRRGQDELTAEQRKAISTEVENEFQARHPTVDMTKMLPSWAKAEIETCFQQRCREARFAPRISANGTLPFPKPPLALPAPEPILPTPTWKKELYTNSQLWPCPFCGSPALPPCPTSAWGVANPNEEHSIACSAEDCMAINIGPTLIDTILRWNKRQSPLAHAAVKVRNASILFRDSVRDHGWNAAVTRERYTEFLAALEELSNLTVLKGKEGA